VDLMVPEIQSGKLVVPDLEKLQNLETHVGHERIWRNCE
jgi:hypothetical protein